MSELKDNEDASGSGEDGVNQKSGGAKNKETTKEKKRGIRGRAPFPSNNMDDVKEKLHDVVVIFGYDGSRNELWLGIILSCRQKGHKRVQYLQAVDGEDGVFTVTAATDVYADHMVEYTFKDTTFVHTTTYEAVNHRRRGRKRKPVVTVKTKEPLDSDVLCDLKSQCDERPPPVIDNESEIDLDNDNQSDGADDDDDDDEEYNDDDEEENDDVDDNHSENDDQNDGDNVGGCSRGVGKALICRGPCGGEFYSVSGKSTHCIACR
jgi:hypothetical protein